MTQRVRTNLIDSTAVTGDKIAADAIRGNNIVAGQITGNLIGTGAVSGNNIVAGTITGSLIADGTITTVKLQDPAGGFEDLFLMGGL